MTEEQKRLWGELQTAQFLFYNDPSEENLNRLVDLLTQYSEMTNDH